MCVASLKRNTDNESTNNSHTEEKVGTQIQK